MKRYFGLISCLFLLWGCGLKSIPEWRTASFNHLEQYKKYFLTGREQLAAIHFQKAVNELKGSGNLSLLMTVYLTRSALHVAILEAPQGEEYLEIAKVWPSDDHQDYYFLLEGRFAEIQKSSLPTSYQDLVTTIEEGNAKRITETIRNIQDDLSRLIAIGVVVRYGVVNEAILTQAVDLASVNGWRKPLLIYLNRLKSFYETTGKRDQAEIIRLKIELLKS